MDSGAVLSQELDSVEQIIAYVSKLLEGNEEQHFSVLVLRAGCNHEDE